MSKRKLDNVLDTNNDTFKRSKSLNSKYIGKKSKRKYNSITSSTSSMNMISSPVHKKDKMDIDLVVNESYNQLLNELHLQREMNNKMRKQKDQIIARPLYYTELPRPKPKSFYDINDENSLKNNKAKKKKHIKSQDTNFYHSDINTWGWT